MASAVFGNYGIRRLLDQNMRFMRGGLAAYLRVKNFQDNPAFADMGFQFVPSATGASVPTGTMDILIDPPPSVRLVSMHTLLIAQMAGSELRAGARVVTLSHTWVIAQMAAQWFQNMCAVNPNLNAADPNLVFKGPWIVGIVSDNLLMQAIDVTHEEVFGQTMTWFLTCNTHELSVA